MASASAAGRFAPPYDDVSLARQLTQAANLSQRRPEHAAALEAALCSLLTVTCTDVITQRDRSDLVDLLLAARRAAHSLLPRQFPREKIELGFQGAIGITAIWAMPFDERIGPYADSAIVWKLWLSMFFADVENVNRAFRLRAMPPPIVLFDLNQPAGGRTENVVSFPPRLS